MSKKRLKLDMVATKHKNKVISCSTPEHQVDSPSRDSDSVCDSEAASPVQFFCTQDGVDGETDVVWNFYTPKSEHGHSRLTNSTPLSRKVKKHDKNKVIQRPILKRKATKNSQKKFELFQELVELNQNIHEIMGKNTQKRLSTDNQSNEDDLLNDSIEQSPKSGLRTNSRCLRKNVLSSKFSKPEPETALESDDSMNECLLKASQIIEENILKHEPNPAKKPYFELKQSSNYNLKPGLDFKMDQDSMDAIISSITLDSPNLNKVKPSCLNNDSFDSLVGNLNDSALDRLTQVPSKSNTPCIKVNTKSSNLTKRGLIEESPKPKSPFNRYNSMPESPSVCVNKPSLSGMVFGRYNSMPDNQNAESTGDSPIRCTPEEIKKKHQLAREKLLAKRILPFTSTQPSSTSVQQTNSNKFKFKQKVPNNKSDNQNSDNSNTTNIKLLIEKKRQTALLKLRKRQSLQKHN